MNNNEYNPSINSILVGILTVEDLRIHLEYIRQIEMILFNVQINIKEQMGVILPHDVKERYLHAIHSAGVDVQDSRGVQLFLADLKNKLKAMPVMGLVLSYLPNEKDLRSYAAFIFANMGRQVVFDVRLDSSLIGGCLLEFNGKVADYSVSKTLDEYVQKNLVKPA